MMRPGSATIRAIGERGPGALGVAALLVVDGITAATLAASGVSSAVAWVTVGAGTRRRTLHQRVARRAQFGYPCSTDVGRVGRASGAGSSCRPSRRRVSLRCPRIQLRGKRTSGGRTGVPRRISGGGGAGVGGVRVRGFRGCRRPALMSAMTIGRFLGPDAGSRLRIAGRRHCVSSPRRMIGSTRSRLAHVSDTRSLISGSRNWSVVSASAPVGVEWSSESTARPEPDLPPAHCSVPQAAAPDVAGTREQPCRGAHCAAAGGQPTRKGSYRELGGRAFRICELLCFPIDYVTQAVSDVSTEPRIARARPLGCPLSRRLHR